MPVYGLGNAVGAVGASGDPGSLDGFTQRYPPVNTAAPSISGTTAYGSTLTCTTGTWRSSDTVRYAYQWMSGTTPVGSNQNTYVTVSGDNTKAITCVVTATNGTGSTPATSSNSITVAGPPVNTVAPVISGNTDSGSTLTATTGTWTGGTTITFSYQWKSNASNVGSNQNTYVSQVSDEGKTVTCVVTGTNNAGNASATSNGIVVTTPPPTYATWDATRTYAGTFSYSGSNLIITHSSTNLRVGTANSFKTSGVWCWQVTVTTDAGQQSMVGVVRSDFNFGIDSYPGQAGTNGAGYYQNTIFKGVDGSATAGHTLAPGDVVTVVLDLDNGKIRFYYGSTSTTPGLINLPGWSAGQAYAPASGNAGATYVQTANFGPTLDSNGVTIAAANSATAGWTV